MQRLKLLTLLTVVLLAFLSPLKIYAQDDDQPADTPPAIVPSPDSNQSNQPVIMDDSDSGGVSEVDEYDN